jgi:ornithine carbamoyltransferase
MTRHFLRDDDLTAEEYTNVLELADEMKRERFAYKPLDGPKSVALMFDKPSTRTRISFTAGITELGGSSIVLESATTQLSRGEPIEDMARVLERQVAAIVWRTFHQTNLSAMATVSRVPVINALTDEFHPCQGLADLMTVRERLGGLSDVTLAYFGDIGNNTANSFMLAGAINGMNIRLAGPETIIPNLDVLATASAIAATTGGSIEIFHDAKLAAYGAGVVATDTWSSMGATELTQEDLDAYEPFSVTEELLDVANADAFVLHCLPAYRGKEISGEVLDGPKCAAWDQAENRLHVQKALLATLLDVPAA